MTREEQVGDTGEKEEKVEDDTKAQEGEGQKEEDEGQKEEDGGAEGRRWKEGRR